MACAEKNILVIKLWTKYHHQKESTLSHFSNVWLTPYYKEQQIYTKETNNSNKTLKHKRLFVATWYYDIFILLSYITPCLLFAPPPPPPVFLPSSTSPQKKSMPPGNINQVHLNKLHNTRDIPSQGWTKELSRRNRVLGPTSRQKVRDRPYSHS